MWSDPLQNAAIRGENIQKAKELGITLEEYLHEQYLENVVNIRIQKERKEKTSCFLFDFFLMLKKYFKGK